MNPTFAMVQWAARDQEEEYRREANHDHVYATSAPRSGPQSRLASILRAIADRLDPEHNTFRTRSIEELMGQ